MFCYVSDLKDFAKKNFLSIEHRLSVLYKWYHLSQEDEKVQNLCWPIYTWPIVQMIGYSSKDTFKIYNWSLSQNSENFHEKLLPTRHTLDSGQWMLQQKDLDKHIVLMLILYLWQKFTTDVTKEYHHWNKENQRLEN